MTQFIRWSFFLGWMLVAGFATAQKGLRSADSLSLNGRTIAADGYHIYLSGQPATIPGYTPVDLQDARYQDVILPGVDGSNVVEVLHFRQGFGEAVAKPVSLTTLLLQESRLEVLGLRSPLRYEHNLAVGGSGADGWIVRTSTTHWQVLRLINGSISLEAKTERLQKQERALFAPGAQTRLFFSADSSHLISATADSLRLWSFDWASGKIGKSRALPLPPDFKLPAGGGLADQLRLEGSSLKLSDATGKTFSTSLGKLKGTGSGAGSGASSGLGSNLATANGWQQNLPGELPSGSPFSGASLPTASGLSGSLPQIPTPGLPGAFPAAAQPGAGELPGSLPTDLPVGDLSGNLPDAASAAGAPTAVSDIPSALPKSPSLVKGSPKDFATSFPSITASVGVPGLGLPVAPSSYGTTAERSYRQLRSPAAIWYFGSGAGISFAEIIAAESQGATDSSTSTASEAPKADPGFLTGGITAQAEGVASIADEAGRLLFYSDGQNVFTSQHEPMENGTGLFGHSSSTQGALIVPVPSRTNDYFLFVTDQGGYAGSSRGLSFNRIDMNNQAGQGEVVEKNVVLEPQSTEKLAAVHHSNGRDIWVVGHRSSSNAFFAYLITPKGIVSTPTVSRVGSIHPGYGNGTLGQLVISPKGDKLAVAVEATSGIELFAFDRSTGVVSSPKVLSASGDSTIKSPVLYPYGVAFSQSGRYLYATDWRMGRLYQYDTEVGDSLHAAGAIQGSQQLIGQEPVALGSLQLAVDGRVYVARRGEQTLGRIEHKLERLDKLASTATYNPTAVALGQGRSEFGLPGIISTLLEPPTAAFTQVGSCTDAPVQFVNQSSVAADSWAWQFGRGAPLVTNAPAHPQHQFSQPGTYQVLLIAQFGAKRDSIFHTITVSVRPELELGPNQTLPEDGSGVELSTGLSSDTPVLWSTGETTPRITVTRPGKYWARTVGEGCQARDEVAVPPQVSASGALTLSSLQKPPSLTLHAEAPGILFLGFPRRSFEVGILPVISPVGPSSTFYIPTAGLPHTPFGGTERSPATAAATSNQYNVPRLGLSLTVRVPNNK